MGADVTVGASDPTIENVVGASVSEVLSSVEIEVGDGVESDEEVMWLVRRRSALLSAC